jgi:hypothetical protein
VEKPELKPCPFCGAPAVGRLKARRGWTWKSDNRLKLTVACSNWQGCGMRLALDCEHGPAEAAARWNRRADA